MEEKGEEESERDLSNALLFYWSRMTRTTNLKSSFAYLVYEVALFIYSERNRTKFRIMDGRRCRRLYTVMKTSESEQKHYKIEPNSAKKFRNSSTKSSNRQQGWQSWLAMSPGERRLFRPVALSHSRRSLFSTRGCTDSHHNAEYCDLGLIDWNFTIAVTKSRLALMSCYKACHTGT